MPAPDTEFSPHEITKRWLWRLGLLFLLLLAALAATFIIWRISLSRRINRTLAAIQKDGYPISLTQLEQKYYPEIPPNENAAIFFEKVFASLLRTNNPKIPVLPNYQSPENIGFFSAEQLNLINRVLINNRASLDLLQQPPTGTNCRYPINLNDGLDIRLSHLASIKECAVLLSLDAIFHTKNHDAARSIADLNAILRLCHSLDREPVDMSQSVQFSLIYIANSGIEHMLNAQQFSDAQLSSLSDAFRHCLNSNKMEYATLWNICESTQFYNFSNAEFRKNTPPFEILGSNLSPKLQNNTYKGMKLAGFMASDYSHVLQVMEEQLQIAKLPFPYKLDAENKLFAKIAHRGRKVDNLDLSRTLLTGLSFTLVKEANARAHLAIIETVLAIERYRLANQNRLPDKLSDLVPAFLDSVPMDPFDGKSIRYKKMAKGYVIYSIGEDRKDDGGVYAYRAKKGAPSDITFVVER